MSHSGPRPWHRSSLDCHWQHPSHPTCHQRPRDIMVYRQQHLNAATIKTLKTRKYKHKKITNIRNQTMKYKLQLNLNTTIRNTQLNTYTNNQTKQLTTYTHYIHTFRNQLKTYKMTTTLSVVFPHKDGSGGCWAALLGCVGSHAFIQHALQLHIVVRVITNKIQCAIIFLVMLRRTSITTTYFKTKHNTLNTFNNH